MTDEARFFRQFVEDVRRCARGHASASVAEIERRVRVAMIAAPSVRERRWSRVVAAVNQLLEDTESVDPQAAARLRAFVRENADLGRPRDFALTDILLRSRPAGTLRARDGRVFVLVDHVVELISRPIAALDEVVPPSTRHLTEWLVYALCGGAALGAAWLAFIVHP